MRRLSLGFALAAMPGCASVFGLATPIGTDGGPIVTMCTPSVPFTMGPTPIGIISNPAVAFPTMNNAATELYFNDGNAPVGQAVILVSTRSSPAALFGAPTTAAFDDTTHIEQNASITSDGLDLVFASNRFTNNSHLNVLEVTRAAVDQPWSLPGAIPSLSTTMVDLGVSISPDGLSLYFVPDANGARVVTRASRTDPWPSVTTAMTVANNVTYPTVSNDGLELFFWPLVDELANTYTTHHRVRSATNVAFPDTPDDLVNGMYSEPAIAVSSTELLMVNTTYSLAYMSRNCK